MREEIKKRNEEKGYELKKKDESRLINQHLCRVMEKTEYTQFFFLSKYTVAVPLEMHFECPLENVNCGKKVMFSHAIVGQTKGQSSLYGKHFIFKEFVLRTITNTPPSTSNHLHTPPYSLHAIPNHVCPLRFRSPLLTEILCAFIDSLVHQMKPETRSTIPISFSISVTVSNPCIAFPTFQHQQN